MEKSLNFYQDILGFKIMREMDESGIHLDKMISLKDVKVKTIKLSVDDGITLVELLEFKSHKREIQERKFFDYGPSHLALTVNNLDMCYNELKGKGIRFNSEPQLSPDGYAKVVFCFDPDDTPIELVEVLK
jgi:catechol 2,3-dioxygenase-like lactoylglutathione lyase family enzyme